MQPSVDRLRSTPTPSTIATTRDPHRNRTARSVLKETNHAHHHSAAALLACSPVARRSANGGHYYGSVDGGAGSADAHVRRPRCRCPAT